MQKSMFIISVSEQTIVRRATGSGNFKRHVVNGASSSSKECPAPETTEPGQEKDLISGLSVKLESPVTEGASIAPCCTSLQGSNLTLGSEEHHEPDRNPGGNTYHLLGNCCYSFKR